MRAVNQPDRSVHWALTDSLYVRASLLVIRTLYANYLSSCSNYKFIVFLAYETDLITAGAVA